MVEVLKPEYGGPVDPKWGTTLQQPQKGLGDEYKPPHGKTEPKPEPDRPKPVPTKPPPKAAGPKPKTSGNPAVDHAVAYAAVHKVVVDPDGAKAIVKAVGPVKAARVPAAYVPRTKTIEINELCPYWKDPAKWMAEQNRDHPPWFSTSNADHIIVHEVGHAKHHEAAGEDRYREVIKRKFSKAEKALVEQYVSRYGATLPVEFVAEMYGGLVAKKYYNEEMSLLYLSLGGPIP